MTPARRRAPASLVAVAATALALVLAGCTGDGSSGGDVDPALVDSVEVPELGACRVLTPDDVAEPSNATETVECSEPHTAETYAIGELPDDLHDVGWDDERLGAFAFETCSKKFAAFLGADESTAMRTVASWAWFRPSEQAWDDGARWYRCDVVGGSDESEGYRDLPETAKGLLLGRPDDRWFVCAAGASVAEGTQVPCSEDHDWRAVTTIVLGDADDDYPGDRLVEVQSRDFCSESVNGWLGYPPQFEFGYTYFHEAEWEAGNRRSICWAKTPE